MTDPPTIGEEVGTSPADILVRDYRATEADALLALFRRAIRHAAPVHYAPEQIAAWASEDIDPRAWGRARAAKPTFVAERASALAGFCDLEPDGHVDMLFVEAAHQGHGVAGALLRTVEAQARSRGLERLYAEVSLTAQRTFERCGFVVLEAQTVVSRGQAFVNLRMQKALSAAEPGR